MRRAREPTIGSATSIGRKPDDVAREAAVGGGKWDARGKEEELQGKEMGRQGKEKGPQGKQNGLQGNNFGRSLRADGEVLE